MGWRLGWLLRFIYLLNLNNLGGYWLYLRYFLFLMFFPSWIVFRFENHYLVMSHVLNLILSKLRLNCSVLSN